MSAGLSIGIVGAGAVVRARHLPVLRSMPEARIEWVADPRAAAREEAAAAAGATAVESPDGLWGAVDVALVCTPPAEHGPAVRAALEGGCHVLVEKPFTLDPGEGRELAELAERAGRVLTIGFNLRQHAGAKALRDAVADGRLGRPQAVRSISSSPGRPGATAWLGDSEAGGDVIWEVGSHHMDLWAWLLGDRLAHGRADGHATRRTVSAVTEGDVAVSGLFAWDAPPVNEIEILGDEARGQTSLYGAEPLQLIASTETGAEPRARLRRAAATAGAVPAMIASLRRGGTFHETYASEWRAFADCVRGDGPNPCPAGDGVVAAEGVRMLAAGP